MSNARNFIPSGRSEEGGILSYQFSETGKKMGPILPGTPRLQMQVLTFFGMTTLANPHHFRGGVPAERFVLRQAYL